MNFAELFREPTEVERKYRKFLESKAKEFDSIIPREITEEYVSYDLTQFKTIDEKVDFLSVFLNSEELYGPYPKKCIEHFFKKEYSEIKYFFYNIEEKGKDPIYLDSFRILQNKEKSFEKELSTTLSKNSKLIIYDLAGKKVLEKKM